MKFKPLLFITAPVAFSCAHAEMTPYEFKRNEILSSAVLNDQFDSIERSQRFYNEKFMRGTSDCTAYGGRGFYYEDRGFTLEEGSLFSTLEFTITVDDQDTVTFSPIDPLFGNSKSGKKAAIAGDQLIFIEANSNNFENGGRLDISIATADRYSLQGELANAVCTKRSAIPAIPSDLLISVVDQDSIALQWTDNSTNELAQKLVITDANSVATVIELSQDVNSYVHTFAEDGRFEFRVRSANAAGESLGSNAVFAEVLNGQIQVF